MRISIIGLGKVGLTLSSCLAAAGHEVVGVDVNAATVDALNRGDIRTPEPGVADRLARVPASGFHATTNVADAVAHTEITFVVVPTPSNAVGGFSLRYVMRACADIGAGLRQKEVLHTVAVVSTILPGSSDAIVIPALERESGRRVGDTLRYCYNPSFIALGEVVRGIEQPDYLLIGEHSREAGDLVLAIHQSMVKNSPPVARMSPVEAEITKIASNTHETMRVSFANMLLEVCSEVPGANVDRITEALAHRMGRRFFKGAVPYGGPCWPRDNRAFSVFLQSAQTSSTLPRAVDTFNEEHGQYIRRKILGLTAAGDRVGLLGLAYKPGTPVIDASFGVSLAEALVREGRSVVAWDPLAADEARAALGDRITYADSGDDCLAKSNATVIVNALPELTGIDWKKSGDRVVIDCWRCLPPSATACIRRYVQIGIGPDLAVADWVEKAIGDRFGTMTS
jgi:UDPglucose 6-dehydrogenase